MTANLRRRSTWLTFGDKLAEWIFKRIVDTLRGHYISMAAGLLLALVGRVARPRNRLSVANAITDPITGLHFADNGNNTSFLSSDNNSFGPPKKEESAGAQQQFDAIFLRLLGLGTSPSSRPPCITFHSEARRCRCCCGGCCCCSAHAASSSRWSLRSLTSAHSSPLRRRSSSRSRWSGRAGRSTESGANAAASAAAQLQRDALGEQRERSVCGPAGRRRASTATASTQRERPGGRPVRVLGRRPRRAARPAGWPRAAGVVPVRKLSSSCPPFRLLFAAPL